MESLIYDSILEHGGKVQIVLKDPTSYHVDNPDEITLHAGQGWTEWEDLITAPDDTCTHEETACNACIRDWGIDYHVRYLDKDGVVQYTTEPTDKDNHNPL